MISNEINLEALAGLNEDEKQLALKILKEYANTGQSEILDDLKYSDFEEIPVDIDTFIWEDQYLGRGLCVVDEFTSEKRCTVFPYWRETLKKIFPDNLTTAYNTLILTGAIGLGKAQPLDAVVLAENGYRKMGELHVGDRVYGPDGKLHNILGVYPQGKKKICQVHFSDGTNTRCCDEHLWTVFDVNKQKWRTIDTKSMITTLDRGLRHSSNRYKIPVTSPIDWPKKQTTVDPYLLGVLIGDGGLTGKHTTFSSSDDEIIKEVRNSLTEGYCVHQLKVKYTYSICKTEREYDPKTGYLLPNKYTQYINYIGLNKRSEFKFIPKEYLYNDVSTRIALLQGLMDTDGFISKDGACLEYATVSKQLRDDLVFLVQSLGGTCHIRSKVPYYKNKFGERCPGRLVYNIGIKLPKNICPFRLTRKKERINPKSLPPFRYITSIEYVDDADCQCIYIDSEEHLYLTNDFIVTHNTLVGVVAELYLLYRMLCLRDPYGYFSMQPIDKITFAMLNITLDAAQGVGWSKAQELLQSSEWFMSHGNMNASRVNPQWMPPKGIELIFGSSNRHIVGRALFANLTDEVNFGIGNNVEKQKAKQKKMIAQIDARMKSRFMKGTYLPTLNIIISSKDTEQAFLDSYIETKKQNESKTTLIVDEPQWVVRPDKGTPDDPGSFYIAVGNKFLAHELLPASASEELVNSYREKGYSMLKIPPGYREDFEDNLDQALMDIAGLSSSSATKYISGVRLNQAKVDTYRNPFTKDIIEVGNSPDDYTQYANFFDLSRVDPRDRTRPLFIHLDMSTGGSGNGDKTGIAGVWITGKRPAANGQDAGRDLEFKLAFSTSVKAPKGFQISFEKTRNFIRWLRDQGFSVKGISSDTYMSAQMHQQLKADNFTTKIISVDRVDQNRLCQPYAFLKSTIYERHIQIYRDCNLLTEELVGLERLSDGHIDHTTAGINSKDQADAVCGALYLASQFAEQYSYDYGESLEAALTINEDTDELKKQRFIADFQNELLGIYKDLSLGERQYVTEQASMYQDIMDGILVF